jgi:putative ABC transport system permease protein
MLAIRDNLKLSLDALRAHKLRAILTTLGLTMGVATLITVMTLVQGANRYVEEKIANLGTNVFQIGRVPFAVTDFNAVIKGLRNKYITLEDMRAVARGCPHCLYVGGQSTTSVRVRYRDHELDDISMIGQTPAMVDIDTRSLARGRYFSEIEDQRAVNVCLIGDTLIQEFFQGIDPIGKTIRVADQEFLVIGTYEKLGSVLGQDQDNFVILPMDTYIRMRSSRFSVVLQVKATGGQKTFERAQDEARMVMRARRHIVAGKEEDFFIGTADSYISLWQSISSAFFSVFIMVSSISAVVGGIVIMNVMLVSVTERTKEIGVRRAVGATQRDILRQFLTESVMQCVIGGIFGIAAGFAFALALREFTSFPASVQTWVAILGVVLSSAIGLFFGIYPAVRASRLDPVVALHKE